MGLVEQLEAIRDAIPRLNNAATVVPSDFSGTLIERWNFAHVVEYDMQPVMLILPERVDDTEAEMHIVLEGRITIDKTHFSEHKQLRTISDGILQHVFGAHLRPDGE